MEAIVGALIGMAGGIAMGLIAIRAQSRNTTMLIESEKERIGLQLKGAEASRLKERRLDRIIDASSELLTVSDPESKLLSYTQSLSCIHRLQLLLDPRMPSHMALYKSLNIHGGNLQTYMSTERSDSLRERGAEMRVVLQSHSEVSDRTRAIILEHYQ